MAILAGAKDIIGPEAGQPSSDHPSPLSWTSGSPDTMNDLNKDEQPKKLLQPIQRPKYKRSFGISQSDDDEKSPVNDSSSPTTDAPDAQPSSTAQSSSSPTNNNMTELRRRQREERNQKMTENIKRIKEKQKEAEQRSRLKARVMRYATYGCIGLAILISAGLVYHYFPTASTTTTTVNNTFRPSGGGS